MASSGKPGRPDTAGGFWQRLIGRAAEVADAPPGEPGTLSVMPQPQARSASSARAGPPADLHDFDLGAELGRGAMAIVYKATQRSTGRQVAIKRLALSREFSADDLTDVRERFMREARAARALQHPDILQVVDAGQDGRDAWLALEYVLGRDLSLFTTASQLLPVREVVQLGAFGWRGRCTMRTARASSIATSSRPTSCWTASTAASS